MVTRAMRGTRARARESGQAAGHARATSPRAAPARLGPARKHRPARAAAHPQTSLSSLFGLNVVWPQSCPTTKSAHMKKP